MTFLHCMIKISDMKQITEIEKRNIKVATAFKRKGNSFQRTFVITPKIILKGNYLQKANFNPADVIEVLLSNGEIVLRKKY